MDTMIGSGATRDKTTITADCWYSLMVMPVVPRLPLPLLIFLLVILLLLLVLCLSLILTCWGWQRCSEELLSEHHAGTLGSAFLQDAILREELDTHTSASPLAGEIWGDMGRFLPISPQTLKDSHGQIEAWG